MGRKGYNWMIMYLEVIKYTIYFVIHPCILLLSPISSLGL